jgi:hypothetical protein
MDDYKTKLQIIFDLDSTLINTFEEFENIKKLEIYSKSENNDLRENIYIFKIHDVMDIKEDSITKFAGFYRPYVLNFLLFCSCYFDKIHIWSAGRYKYVHKIINELFKKNNIKKPSNIYTYDDCIFNKNNSIFKPLGSTIFKDKSTGSNPQNTLVVDDRKDTFSKNIKNGILIPEYFPSIDNKESILKDICLLQLTQWLLKEEVINSKDVRTLDKSKIFEENIDKKSIIKFLNKYHLINNKSELI